MFIKPKPFDYLETICSNYKEGLGEESLAQALKLQFLKLVPLVFGQLMS